MPQAKALPVLRPWLRVALLAVAPREWQGMVPLASAMLAVGQRLGDKLPAGAAQKGQAPAGRALPAAGQQPSAGPPLSAGVGQRSAAQRRGEGHRSVAVFMSLWDLCIACSVCSRAWLGCVYIEVSMQSMVHTLVCRTHSSAGLVNSTLAWALQSETVVF